MIICNREKDGKLPEAISPMTSANLFVVKTTKRIKVTENQAIPSSFKKY